MFDLSAVILAGGKSRRMKKDKALLTLGGKTFSQRLLAQLENRPPGKTGRGDSPWSGRYGERLFSAGRGGARTYAGFGVPVIEDRYPDRGPLGGMCTALEAAAAPFVLILSVDIPCFDGGFVEFLIKPLSHGFDAVIPKTRDGRIHPLCAVYAKTCQKTFWKSLQHRNNRVMDALWGLRINYPSLADGPFGEKILDNINTPETYQALSG
ncbi:MAG: molybdenum cofactor guanylyltransferase [Spirochaetales bacterium]|jgi:molybdopterin-guanine dinucleotide biosynthesis protein A|nr:molybdenum cofactor guanylyltransferase [Spirochaetales bacterium]